MLDLLVSTATAIALLMTSVWVLSVYQRNAAIVDVFWGLGFALVALVGFFIGGGHAPRVSLITALTVIWGVRLAGHLAWRNHGQGEDYRYQAMRRSIGDNFWIVSLFSVFGLQGVLMWVVALPIQVAQSSSLPITLNGFDALGVLLWCVGLSFEAIGDWQLARFKADPSNRGKVMDRGLWRYTRHPNYFGDALLWWGLFVIAFATPHSWWTVIGPLVMTGLLMRVSGVPLLERKLVRTRPQYAEYVRRTSSFIPWWPRA